MNKNIIISAVLLCIASLSFGMNKESRAEKFALDRTFRQRMHMRKLSDALNCLEKTQDSEIRKKFARKVRKLKQYVITHRIRNSKNK
jgi:hypothetical protein